VNMFLVDYLLENKKILPVVFSRERSYNLLPAFLELIKVRIANETITLSCKYSIESLGVVLSLINKDNRKSYGFIRDPLEKLARAVYETESKKLKWGRSWIKVENQMQDWNDMPDETIAERERNYLVTVNSLLEDYTFALKKQTKTSRTKLIAEFNNKTQILANEFLRHIKKAAACHDSGKIFTVRIFPVGNVNLQKEIERIAFSYATHDLKSKEFLEKFFKGKDGEKRKEFRTNGIIESLVQEGVIASQGLPTKEIRSLDELRHHLAARLGRSRLENCSYCGTSFYKVLERGRARRKYCDKPSCRTLAYRKRKRTKQNKGS